MPVIKEIILAMLHGVIYAFFDLPLFRPGSLAFMKTRVFNQVLGCRLSGSCFLHRGVRFLCPRNVQIGADTSVMYGTTFEAREQIRIGKNTLVSPEVFITTGTHDLSDLSPEARPVIIGDNCFIGTRAIILPGVTIGDNSVVGAGSVVTKDVPAGVLAAGVPAKVIKGLDYSDQVWTLLSGLKARQEAMPNGE